MQTSIDREIVENRRWKLRSPTDSQPVHAALLQNEFLDADESGVSQKKALRQVLEHCYDTVPYYREMFQQKGIRRRDLRESSILEKIPVLEKGQVELYDKQLRAKHLLPGQTIAGTTQTSGSTGQPTIIEHSDLSLGFFRWLKQRELRWFRFDPMGTQLAIRPFIELPSLKDGSWLRDGDSMSRDGWPYLEDLFETGPFVGFNNTNPVLAQRDLLEQVQPGNLLLQSSCLEYLSMQDFGESVLANLEGAVGISQTLTPAMREQVESAFGVPVHQNYGLNEIGLVASRCPEGGRYHVHSEHCLVEIINEDGSACEDGEVGKLLVTALSNSAMPLIRYDADDLAQAVAGPCPCGRTLPSFGAIQGRYRRTAYLPEGTLQRWGAIQLALYKLAAQQKSSVRKYQVSQDEAGDFLLRLDCDESIFDSVCKELQYRFAEAYLHTKTPTLYVFHTTDFIDANSRKFQNFISAFTPEMDT